MLLLTCSGVLTLTVAPATRMTARTVPLRCVCIQTPVLCSFHEVVSIASQALGKYVGSLLEPLYAAKRLSKDQFKAVARRAAEKVSSVRTSACIQDSMQVWICCTGPALVRPCDAKQGSSRGCCAGAPLLREVQHACRSLQQPHACPGRRSSLKHAGTR